MAPQTGTAILIIAIFVLPGFVTLLVRERTFTVPGQQSPFERLLNALYFSALVFCIVLGLGLLAGLNKADVVEIYQGRKPLGQTIGAAAALVLLVPVLVADASRRWRGSKRLRPWTLDRLGISRGHSVSSGWNQAFSELDGAFIRVTTNDGRVVGGLYATGSLAGYSEQAQDLYISERWELDDDFWFVVPADRSLGFWVPRENIASLELYAIE
jgi:hypothetical protein